MTDNFAAEGLLMKRALVVVISLTAALLVYAALDDITTGTEPNRVLEWCVVVAGVHWFAALAILKARGGHNWHI